jgi:hypothetical protein
MNESTYKAFIAFLFVFTIMTVSQLAFAAVALSPTVPGYSGANFAAPAGSFSMTPANDGYIKPSVVNVAGKSVTVPATLRIASNAGQYAKNAIRLNPWGIIGTLAAGYLLEQGLEWMEDTQEWMRIVPGVGYYRIWGGTQHGYVAQYWRIPEQGQQFCDSTHSYTTTYQLSGDNTVTCLYNGTPVDSNPANWYVPDSTMEPMTPGDWDSLPDPLPLLAPELPYAPYVQPDGVPVEEPVYDFAPMSVPVGEPYARPDGSTVQPMASISPNGDKVTVDTFDQPLTDPQGQPVSNPLPQDTTETQPTDCEKFPNSLGCADMATPDSEALQSEDFGMDLITPVTSGKLGQSGSCPAPLVASFLGQQVEFTFDPLCSYANALKPLVLVMAWLAAGVIFIGGVRNG